MNASGTEIIPVDGRAGTEFDNVKDGRPRLRVDGQTDELSCVPFSSGRTTPR